MLNHHRDTFNAFYLVFKPVFRYSKPRGYSTLFEETRNVKRYNALQGKSVVTSALIF